MKPETFLDGKVSLFRGDCLEILPTLEPNSIDAVCCDPPYHLTSIVKRFGAENSAPCKVGKTGAYARASKGFMGKQWDGGDIAFNPLTWELVFRVLKPGAHLLAFGGTRTYHRMACAIEDAGFEIRDQIGWCYGSGFPKSHDVSKGIDRRKDWTRLADIQGVIKTARLASGKTLRQIGDECGEKWWHRGGSFFFESGWHIPTQEQWSRLKACLAISDEWDAVFERATREVVGTERRKNSPSGIVSCGRNSQDIDRQITAPATEAAIQWQGWGTALKPAWEPIVLARKPLSEKSVAANVLKHGTGAINIDGCRVSGDVSEMEGRSGASTRGLYQGNIGIDQTWNPNKQGRFPANLIHDGSEEVLEGFPESDHPGDSGSAARFFYTAKANADDRLGSRHPTIKPLDLIQYLVRLVTPKSGCVLDLFAGTGTTGEAAFREGLRAVLIERECDYQADIVKRMGLALAGPDARRAASVKQLPIDDLPMFGGAA